MFVPNSEHAGIKSCALRFGCRMAHPDFGCAFWTPEFGKWTIFSLRDKEGK